MTKSAKKPKQGVETDSTKTEVGSYIKRIPGSRGIGPFVGRTTRKAPPKKKIRTRQKEGGEQPVESETSGGTQST